MSKFLVKDYRGHFVEPMAPGTDTSEDPFQVVLHVKKGDYELFLNRQGLKKANKTQLRRVLGNLWSKESKNKKRGKKHGKVQ